MVPFINKFSINGLFGQKNVTLNFNSNVHIYIGENGLGKTTILNIIYYTLSLNFTKLSKLYFNEIKINFQHDSISFSKEDLIKYLNVTRSRLMRYINENINNIDIERIREIYNNKKKTEEDKAREIRRYFQSLDIRFPFPPLSSRYLMIASELLEPHVHRFDKIRKTIMSNIESKILYFPTYRRIEEDLDNLDFINITSSKRHKIDRDDIIFIDDSRMIDDEEDDFNQRKMNQAPIQFGMKDVEEKINIITNNIIQSSIIGFSKLTGDMLIQLLNGYPNISHSEQFNIDDIKIILNRVGDNMLQSQRDKIIQLVASNEISKIENKQIIYFLNKLLEIYKSQSIYDTAIKKFITVCNDYLNDKHFEYNESKVELNVVRNRTNDKIELSQLSSGEKQIVSLFSKIYLDPGNNFIILFDEPELSLSLQWQQKLLPNVLASGRCVFLIAVTHSPFIFENDLIQNAESLKESCQYIEANNE